jgi:hypothetical protein
LFERGLEGKLVDLRWEAIASVEALVLSMKNWKGDRGFGRTNCSLLVLKPRLLSVYLQQNGRSNGLNGAYDRKYHWPLPSIHRAAM